MKSFTIALVALMLTVLSGTQVKAQNNTVNGLIIGTAVGSFVGFIIGNEMDRSRYQKRHVNHHPVVYAPPPPPKRYYGSNNHFRHNYRFTPNHREVVVIRDQHGPYQKNVRTIYRDKR